jgi:hypothetical protein
VACGVCKGAIYCCTQCQVNHWPKHKDADDAKTCNTSLYRVLNDRLQTACKTPQSATDEFALLIPILRLLLQGMAKCEMHDGLAFKGMLVSPEVLDTYLRTPIFCWAGFCITSKDPKFLELFDGAPQPSATHKPILFEIECREAYLLQPYSAAPDPDQVVLPPFSTFYVQWIRREGDFTRIRLQQLQQPYVHLNRHAAVRAIDGTINKMPAGLLPDETIAEVRHHKALRDHLQQAALDMHARLVSGALVTDEQLWEQFSTFDIDGNGWLDKDQFRLIYQTCNPLDAGDDEHIEDVLAQYDMLGDDRISYHEFANIMLRLARE